MGNFRICQMSDLHLTLLSGITTNGIDIVSNFERVLGHLVSGRPDLIVISGDLCLSSSEKQTYKYIKEQLDLTKIPYVIMAGNHDDSKDIASVFDLASTPEGDLFSTIEAEGYILIFADSSKNIVSADQLSRIDNLLDGPLKPVLFIHHPPVVSGVPFMDNNYPLKNMDEVQKILSRYNGNIPVFCGHYHNDVEVKKGNLSAYLTPSTYYQISRETAQFQISSEVPGWRDIVLSDPIETEVKYLNL